VILSITLKPSSSGRRPASSPADLLSAIAAGLPKPVPRRVATPTGTTEQHNAQPVGGIGLLPFVAQHLATTAAATTARPTLSNEQSAAAGLPQLAAIPSSGASNHGHSEEQVQPPRSWFTHFVGFFGFANNSATGAMMVHNSPAPSSVSLPSRAKAPSITTEPRSHSNSTSSHNHLRAGPTTVASTSTRSLLRALGIGSPASASAAVAPLVDADPVNPTNPAAGPPVASGSALSQHTIANAKPLPTMAALPRQSPQSAADAVYQASPSRAATTQTWAHHYLRVEVVSASPKGTRPVISHTC
jgi:hypothetical protein